MSDRSPIAVLIVADDPLVQAGWAMVLAEQALLNLMGQVASDDLTDFLPVYEPDVVVWDLGWGTEDAPAGLDEIPYPLIVLLPDDELAEDVFAAGVKGVLLRQVTAERLAVAVQAVAQGLVVLDEGLRGGVMVPAGELPTLPEPLTPRENEVLQLLAEGLTNRAIAQALEISEHTIKFHVTAIMTKLAAQSRTQAVVQATRLGLILL